MTLKYGFVKCKIKPATDIFIKSSYLAEQHEKQYHLHATLLVGTEEWDTAVNVGTNDSDDLLRYKFVTDYSHALLSTLSGAADGKQDQTNKPELPSLDFLRSDILEGTGPWRLSDVMNGNENKQPYADLKNVLTQAQSNGWYVYIFGRFYYPTENGLHDVHMNQGSSGKFLNHGKDFDSHGKLIDHNEVWQDGAVFVDVGEPEWVAYFTAFTQQLVPTDDKGNPSHGGHPIDVADEGKLAGA